MVQGPPRGYLLDPTKRILVVYPRNVPQAEAFFWGYGMQVVTGSRYLRGFVGTETAQAWWFEEKVVGGQYLVSILAGVAHWPPQTAYAVLQKYLHQEWDFVQCATPDIGMAFQPVEDELQDTFLPDLFQGATPQISGRVITSLPVKQAGITLPNPNQTAVLFHQMRLCRSAPQDG